MHCISRAAAFRILAILPANSRFWMQKKTFDSMLSSGKNELRNYLALRSAPTAKLYAAMWNAARGNVTEGINLPESRAIRQAVKIR